MPWAIKPLTKYVMSDNLTPYEAMADRRVLVDEIGHPHWSITYIQ
jgi:hypothetical protein